MLHAFVESAIIYASFGDLRSVVFDIFLTCPPLERLVLVWLDPTWLHAATKTCTNNGI